MGLEAEQTDGNLAAAYGCWKYAGGCVCRTRCSTRFKKYLVVE